MVWQNQLATGSGDLKNKCNPPKNKRSNWGSVCCHKYLPSALSLEPQANPSIPSANADAKAALLLSPTIIAVFAALFSHPSSAFKTFGFTGEVFKW